MSSAAAELLSMGILLDILDEEWMRDTLPHDGYFLSVPLIVLFLFLSLESPPELIR